MSDEPRPTLDETLEAVGLKPDSDAPPVVYDGPSLPPGVELTMSGRPGEPLVATVSLQVPTNDEVGQAINNAIDAIRGFRGYTAGVDIQRDSFVVMAPRGVFRLEAGEDGMVPGSLVELGDFATLVQSGETPMGTVESVNGDGTVNVRFGHPPPSAGRPILESHYLEHLGCDELCRNAWARMVGKVPSEAVLRHLEGRPGCAVARWTYGHHSDNSELLRDADPGYFFA